MVCALNRFWGTIRYLRPRQIFYQARHRFIPRRWRLSQVPKYLLNLRLFPLERFPDRPQSFFAGNQFRFLNKTVELGRPINWSAPGLPRLWQYNLHSFDFLLHPNVDYETGDQLVREWIENHPPTNTGTGWEPYPLSLRIVNWLKFLSKWGRSTPPLFEESLSLQLENLKEQIEYHLLGNHLFANGKAIWFAGIFSGNEEWEHLGKKIILKEIGEQFLLDGGHFELSPMYHCLILEDLLDLSNVLRSKNESSLAAAAVRKAASKALGWLNEVVDEHDRIPLLNDSVFGIATAPMELRAYAARLGLQPDCASIPRRQAGQWKERNLSGYRILSNADCRLLLDTSLLGPDYLPGHAHGDLLSVLFSFRGTAIFADTGVYEYAEGKLRDVARSTAAHNTVSVDGLDQAEFWKSFRVGRRGRPIDLELTPDSISCAHDGFMAQGNSVKHTRSLKILPNGFEILDELTGTGRHDFAAFFHCHPGTKIAHAGTGGFLINDALLLQTSNCSVEETVSDYFPEYGLIEKRPCLVLKGSFEGKTAFGVRCTYSS